MNPEQVRDEAHAWVARFAPLVLGNDILTENEVRHRIATAEVLQEQGKALQDRLASISQTDPELIKTVHSALSELESIETDFRLQLGRLAPGDPAGRASLDAVNERLAERLARKEVGLPTTSTIPDVLELKVSPGNKAAAAGLGIFGLGWNSFTAVHATFMIGGMAQAFGWAALGLLAFYGIFFSVGVGMWIAAYHAAASESIKLEGRKLSVTRKLGPILKTKEYQLPEGAQATISVMDMPRMSNNRGGSKPTPVIQLHDVDGNAIGIGATSTDVQRRQNMDKINSYLKIYG